MDLGSNLHCVCAVWEPTPWGKKKKSLRMVHREVLLLGHLPKAK